MESPDRANPIACWPVESAPPAKPSRDATLPLPALDSAMMDPHPVCSESMPALDGASTDGLMGVIVLAPSTPHSIRRSAKVTM